MCTLPVYLYYIKNDHSPQPNGGGYWSYRLTISYDADEEFSRLFKNTHMVRSTVTEREAREGFSRDLAGEVERAQPSSILYIHTYIHDDEAL